MIVYTQHLRNIVNKSHSFYNLNFYLTCMSMFPYTLTMCKLYLGINYLILAFFTKSLFKNYSWYLRKSKKNISIDQYLRKNWILMSSLDDMMTFSMNICSLDCLCSCMCICSWSTYLTLVYWNRMCILKMPRGNHYHITFLVRCNNYIYNIYMFF